MVNALPDKKPLRMMDSDVAATVEYGLKLTDTDNATQMTFDAAVDQMGVRRPDRVYRPCRLLPNDRPECQGHHHVGRPPREQVHSLIVGPTDHWARVQEVHHQGEQIGLVHDN